MSASDQSAAEDDLRGTVVVVKFGGNAMVNQELFVDFADQINDLRDQGILPVICHGGGPQIQELLNRLQIDSEFRAGLRVTSTEAVVAVRMALAGQVQRDLVNSLNRGSARAVGITGEDGATLLCRRHQVAVDDELLDIGWVGDVVSVDTSLLWELISAGRIPVVSSIGVDTDRNIYNVNADSAAGAIAAALGASRLVMMTDVAGLYRDWPTSEEVVQELTAQELSQIMPTLDGGMIPKMRACLSAVLAGVDVAHVVDGRVPASVTSVLSGQGIGTRITGGGS